MKNVSIKALLAVTALAASASALAVPVTVYLNQDGLRAGSGTYYSLFFDGSDGNPASTATWTWDSATGILAGTGFMRANQRLGSTTGGASLISDVVTSLVIDTIAGTTTASTYSCVEGTFGAGTGANQCLNTSFGFNAVNDSSALYNVNGNASCEERTVGGDDASGASGSFRGLRSWNGTGNALCGGATTDGNNTGNGALDMIHIALDATGSGGQLVLYNSNTASTFLPDYRCLNPGSAGTADPTGNLCSRAHWLSFSTTVPVPAAVWMFGSALGLLGWVRRRAVA